MKFHKFIVADNTFDIFRKFTGEVFNFKKVKYGFVKACDVFKINKIFLITSDFKADIAELASMYKMGDIFFKYFEITKVNTAINDIEEEVEQEPQNHFLTYIQMDHSWVLLKAIKIFGCSFHFFLHLQFSDHKRQGLLS